MAVDDVLKVQLNYINYEEVLSSTFHYRETVANDRSVGAKWLAKAFVDDLIGTGINPIMPSSWRCHSVLVTYPDVEFANGWEEVFNFGGASVSPSLPDMNFANIELIGTDAGANIVKSSLQWTGIAGVNATKTRLSDAYIGALVTVIDQLKIITSGISSGSWELVVPTRPNLPDRTIVPVTVQVVNVPALIGARYDRKMDTPNTGRKENGQAAGAKAKRKGGSKKMAERANARKEGEKQRQAIREERKRRRESGATRRARPVKAETTNKDD